MTKYAGYLLVLFLVSGCSDFKKTITKFDVDGSLVKINLQIIHRDSINRYTVEHQIIIDRDGYGTYRDTDIQLIALNGGHKLETVGGYVRLHASELEVRLLTEIAGVTPVLYPYIGNDLYRLSKKMQAKLR